MEAVRFPCVLDPEIENSLYSEQYDEDELVNFFSDLGTQVETVKDHVLVFIPHEIRYLFKTQKLKTILSVFSAKGSQSKISFVGAKKKDDCQEECVGGLFPAPNSPLSYRIIVNLMYEMKFPFVVGLTSRSMDKAECGNCIGQKYCGFEFQFNIEKLEGSIEHIRNKVTELKDLIENGNPLNVEGITLENIKLASKYVALSRAFPTEKLQNLESIFCVDNFFSDLNQITVENLKDIGFSILRCLAFQRTDDRAKMEEYSIDWHPHNPKTVQGISIFRCDVVKPHERGVRKSGSKRLIFAIYNSKKIFLAYDPDHNISDEKVNERVGEMIAKFDKT